MLLNDRIFQTEVGKYVTDDNNLIVNSMSMATNTLVNASRNGVEVTLNDGVFSVKAQGLTGFNFTGFSLPIYVKKIYHGETYTLGFKYRFKTYPDHDFAFNVKNHKLNKILLNADIGKNRPPLNEWQEFQQTFTVREDFLFGEDRNFPFYIYLVKNGWVEFKEPILVRGSSTGPYKPSQFDDAYKASNEAKDLASDAQAKAIQVAQGTEAVRTQVTQLNNSWSVRNLNSAGDVLGQLNLNPDGSIRINEGLLSIGEKTYIKDGVIKGAMIGKAQIDTAHIKEIDASRANIFNLNVNNINGLNAEFIKAKIEYALVDWMKGKKISALNDKTVIDLNEGTINLFSNTGTIRRIDNTSSSQFLKMTRSGFIAEHFQDPNSAMIVLGTNHDKTENTNNATFAGTRLWSGSGNGVNESFYELVADRIAIYSNGKYRSPWLIHNNTEDGNTYLIPMNENGVKHNLGRGDKHFSKAYIDDLFIGKGSQNVGGYLWDILTCFGIIARYGWDLKNSSVQSHVRSVFTKYGFK